MPERKKANFLQNMCRALKAFALFTIFGGQLGESLKDFPFTEMAYNLLNTEISYSIIANMLKACERYYNTMLSSDIEYLVKPYTWDELLNLITTK